MKILLAVDGSQRALHEIRFALLYKRRRKKEKKIMDEVLKTKGYGFND